MRCCKNGPLLIIIWSAMASFTPAQYVLPQMGGGQVGQGSAPMKHIDILFDGMDVALQVDNSVATPVLRPLERPLEFDPALPWHVLSDTSYNFQYGWNPAGFISLPPGAWIWIEQTESVPGLEVYQRPPAAPAYAPIFGTADSPARWRWSGSMTHNVYAVSNPLQRDWAATYRVYLGDDVTGEPIADYGAASITLEFLTHILGDFDDNRQLDCSDIDALAGAIAEGSHDAAFDLTHDGFVDLSDRDTWLAQAGAARVDVTGGNPFFVGDANVDGAVDASDFNVWNGNKYASIAAWCSGDFNADGVVDGSDFNSWNANKFNSSVGGTTLSEPATGFVYVIALWICSCGRRQTHLGEMAGDVGRLAGHCGRPTGDDGSLRGPSFSAQYGDAPHSSAKSCSQSLKTAAWRRRARCHRIEGSW